MKKSLLLSTLLSLSSTFAANNDSEEKEKTKDEISITGENIEDIKENLGGLNFKGASLAGLDLSERNFSEADFSKAFLFMTIFYRTDATGASFYRTDLTFTNFTEANLTFTNFTGAIMTQKKIKEYYLENRGLITPEAYHEKQKKLVCGYVREQKLPHMVPSAIPMLIASFSILWHQAKNTR